MAESNQTSFEDSSHKSDGNSYFQEWQGSDAIFIVDDTKLFVHSQILSLASPVFNRMFTTGFKEGQTKVVYLPGKNLCNMINMLNLVYPTEHKIAESTNCVDLLELAKEYDIKRIFNLVDDFMAMFAPKDVQTLKLAEEFDLQRTKDASIRALVNTKDKRVFGSPKYKSLKSSSKLSITQGKIKLTLTACDELCASVAQQNCQHGYLIHPPFSFKGHTDTICCRKEGPLEILNKLRSNELAMLKATLD